MKNKLISFALLFCLLISFCSCSNVKSKQIHIEMDEAVSEHFSDCMSIGDIFEDIGNIDFYYKPDTSGLTSETKRDEENDTSDIYWTDKKGKVIYKFYEGYGEKCFDFFTCSESGRDVKVNYWDNDGERYSVTVSCDEYSICFYQLNRESTFGADSIDVSVLKTGDSLFKESINYECYEGEWTVYPCFFTDDEGCKQYWTYRDDETGTIQSAAEIIHRHITSEPECRSDMLTDEMISIVPEFIIPRYELSYLGDPDNGQWFITADFVLTFENEDIRDNYAKKFGITGGESCGNEDDYLTLRTGEITIPIAKDFEGLSDFINLWDVNDCYYKAVVLNGKGEITSFYSTGNFSLY